MTIAPCPVGVNAAQEPSPANRCEPTPLTSGGCRSLLVRGRQASWYGCLQSGDSSAFCLDLALPQGRKRGARRPAFAAEKVSSHVRRRLGEDLGRPTGSLPRQVASP